MKGLRWTVDGSLTRGRFFYWTACSRFGGMARLRLTFAVLFGNEEIRTPTL
jgi:hypothetical protein